MAKAKTQVQVAPGARFRSVIADANVLWEVKRSRGRGVWDCEAVNEPVEIEGKTYPSDYAGQHKVFDEKEIAAAVGMEKLWDRLGNEHDAFYAGLKLGQGVHYHNGFGQYVRCQVVRAFKVGNDLRELVGIEKRRPDEQHALKPIALVGDWKSYDLPKRERDGSIRLGYHAERIQNGDLMTPNCSNVYEYPKFSARGSGDPAKLPALALTVPPLTADAEATAKLWRAVAVCQAALDGTYDDPRERLVQAQAIIAGVLS